MYIRIWRFRPHPKKIKQFETVYGSRGDWAKLFKMSLGYLGTELIQSHSDSSEYLTIDRWIDESSWNQFKKHHHQEYDELNERCSALTIEESEVGTFIQLAP